MQCRLCKRDNPDGARFCANCGASLSITSVPGVISSYKNGWRQMWKYFWILLGVTIVYYVISFIPTVLDIFIDSKYLTDLFNWGFSIFIMTPLGFGCSFASLKAAREDPVEFNDIFEGFRNYWNAILAGILVGIIVLAGFILLVIPGIYLLCKLAFTPYLVVDRKMGAIDAIHASWQMTSGFAWKVFLTGLLSIPIIIAGLICLVIGVIPAIIWVAVAFASLYHAVSKLREVPPQEGIVVN